MKILTVCQHGNNRSVQFAHLLRYKYPGSDTIPVGVDKFTAETLTMLYNWAEIIIVTDESLVNKIPTEYDEKIKVWNVGEDRYPRPFNKELADKAKKLIEENPLWV